MENNVQRGLGRKGSISDRHISGIWAHLVAIHEVDHWHAKLTELGVTCTHAPSYRPEFHIYNAFFGDPTNYAVEIQAFDSEYAPR